MTGVNHQIDQEAQLGYTLSMPKKRMEAGEPVGTALPHPRSVRFSDRDAERLRRLAEKLELPESMVIRMAIRRLAGEEGVE